MKQNRSVSASEQYVKSSNKKIILFGVIFLLIALIAWFFIAEYKQEAPDRTSIDFTSSAFDRTTGKDASLANFPRGSAALSVQPTLVTMDNVVLGSRAEAVVTLTAQNAPILFLGASLAELQQDGFILDSSCTQGARLEANTSCNIRVLWNPVALRQIQNNLNITWKEDNPSIFKNETTTVQIRAQSTDSKDCVICEDVRAQAEKEPVMAMGVDGQLHEVDPEGYVTVDGQRYRVTENGLIMDENGNILGVATPQMIPMGINNQLLGTISDTRDVIGQNGEKLGRLLGDNTIVDSSLNVLGAALPVVPVMDENGNVIAKTTVEGTVVDGRGAVIGRMLVDNSVVDLNGTVIGSLMPWGLATDFLGQILGGIIPSGAIINGGGQTVGRITPTGIVVNTNNEVIGSAVTTGVAVTSGCQTLGTILLNGRVKDSYEQIIGVLLPGGTIVDTNAKPMGMAVSQGLVVDEKGTVLGFVNSEGKAVDAKGSVIGCINPDGSVSAGKRVIGAVMNKGRVIGRGCQVLGSVYPNGSVVSSGGDIIAKVISSGYVKNPRNQITGVVIPNTTAIAEGCRLLGIISINGQIKDNANVTIGCVSPEKKIVNTQNETIGGITPRGFAADANGKIIGFIRIDGKVMNENGQIVGCVNPDGSITTMDGKPLGSALTANSETSVMVDSNGNPTNVQGTVQPNGWVTDENGNLVGMIPPDGVIFSPEGVVLGRYSRKTGTASNAAGDRFARILPDFTAVSSDKGEIIGALIPDNSSFMDINKSYMGTMRVDGQLMNTKNETIGTIRADGSVVNKSGKMIGARIPQGRILSVFGKEIGTVTEKGDVLSPARTKIGTVLANGLAISTEGTVIGAVFPETPVIPMSAEGSLGAVTYQGVVNDKAGRVIGTISPFGHVLSPDGDIIGNFVRAGAVIDLSSKTLGWSSLDGIVSSKEGTTVGRLSMNGAVLDKANAVIGSLTPKGISVTPAGTFLGVNTPAGNILDEANKVAGTHTASVYVYNGQKEVVGRQLPLGVAVDNSGAFLGWSRFDGMIENQKQVLGQVSMDNTVLSSNGNVLGVYLPFSAVVINDDNKVVGIVNTDGSIVNTKGAKQGQAVSTKLVISNGKLVGRIMPTGIFANDLISGKAFGQVAVNGTAVQTGSNKALGSLSTNGTLLSLTRQVIGGISSTGIALAPNLGLIGQTLSTGDVVVDGKIQASTLGNSVSYNPAGKVAGGVFEPATFIGRDGAVIGSSTGTSTISKGGRKVAEYMPFGSALTIDTLWAGGALPMGVAVTDDAFEIGTSAADGAVIGANNAVMARVMSDGAIVGVTDRSLFTTMPYVGGLAKQGLPLGYKAEVLGRTTLSGDIIDAADKKIYRTLDDGTILGKATPLAGVIVPFGTAVAYNGDIMGTLGGDGKVISYANEMVGTIATNGAVKGNNNLKIIGALIPEPLITNDCKMVGQTAYTGQVINGRGEVVGRIQPDKWVINSKGEKIGRVTRNGLALSPSGDYLGRTLPDAVVVDTRGVNIGCARNDGSIVDNAGNIIGHVVDRGPVFDTDGNLIGRVKANGTIVDTSNTVIGKMLGDGRGTAVNLDGDIIGRMASRDDELIFNPDGTLAGTFNLDGVYKDPSGLDIFKVLPNGDIVDPYTGRKLASLGDDGQLLDEQGNNISDITLLRDKNGNLLGIVSGCDVINSAGQKIASIMPDGSIIDLNGERFGTILGNGTLLAPDGSEMGTVSGTSTKLDRCGIKSVSKAGGDSAASGRRIFIGNKVFGISSTGSLIDEDGTIVGYMGDDGRPYSLDNRILTGTDSTGRAKPNLNKKVQVNSEQLQQMQQLLAQKRESMKRSMGTSALTPSGKVQARGKKKQDKDWGIGKIVSSWPVDMSRMILKDKAIPAVIVHAIDSRYATAPVTAIVERHVYAESGRNIIIPAGSRLIGSFSGSPGSDHVAKMDISWSRLIRPDGGAFQFSATSGDAQGRGGVAAYLSEELLQRYGKPVLSATVTSAIAYMTAVNDDITTKDNGDVVQSAKSQAADDARNNFVDAMGDVFNQLLDESTNVKPVVFVPSGTRITVFANEDLWLRSEDDDEQDYNQQFGADSTQAAKPTVPSWVDTRGGFQEIGNYTGATGADAVDYYNPDDVYQPVYLEDVQAQQAAAQQAAAQPQQPTSPSVVPIYNGGQTSLEDRISQPVLPKTNGSDRMF
ncbi:MAG: hypothetical protein LBU87_01335 [Lactobacillales bacterium]|jgi:type IV secretory pathway VirB10-like protein|nr:hypothetical protein [Lactobacillales bacterium]